MNILYIEDNPNDAKLVELYVRSTPHNVQLAPTLEAARSALEQPTNFDLIMVDVMLDNSRSGYLLVEELRANGYTMPIIAVTGLATAQDREACERIGFNYVLNKPFHITELARAIQAAS